MTLRQQWEEAVRINDAIKALGDQIADPEMQRHVREMWYASNAVLRYWHLYENHGSRGGVE